jgi:predicted nucleotidyltransferase
MIPARTDFSRLLRLLLDASVEFILVGGVAGTLHGAARATYDIDVVYRRSPENMSRLVTALAPYSPYLRGAPAGLPFSFDVVTLRQGLNFTLTTTLGDIDLLGEIPGGGAYEALLAQSESIPLLGTTCRCVTLEGLIRLKRAAGRPKDLEAIAELEALRSESGLPKEP